MLLLEQRRHAGHVRAGHRGAGIEIPLGRRRHATGRHGIALRLRQIGRHAGQHVGAGRREIRFQDVRIGHVRPARGTVADDRRLHRGIRDGMDFAQCRRAVGRRRHESLQRVALHLRQVHGRQHMRLVDDGVDATGHVGDDHARRARRFGIRALVDQHVAATVAHQHLARHFRRVQVGRGGIGHAEAAQQVDIRRQHAGQARVARADQRQRRRLRIARRAFQLAAVAEDDIGRVQAVVGGIGHRRQPRADVRHGRRQVGCGRGRAGIAARRGNEYARCRRAEEGHFRRLVEGAAARVRADGEVDDVDAILDRLIDGGHAVGRGAAVAPRRGSRPADFIGGDAGARRHARRLAQRGTVRGGQGAIVAACRGRRMRAMAAVPRRAGDGIARR